jgi:hypothetical protein
LGNESVKVYQGSAYHDAGATASDLKDGEVLVSNVIRNSSNQVVQSIDTSTPSTYTITYTAKDNNGNISTLTRTINIVESPYSIAKGVNKPELASGMTPIKWNGSTWVDTVESDNDWYNYTTTDKKWANARTADGSMWVWIPRYIYKISSGWHSSNTGTIEVQFSKGTDDNWNNASIGNIETDPTANASNNKWTNHPAFTFGDTEVTGVWVAKFEASSSNPAFSNGGGDRTTLKVKSLPNVTSWRGIQFKKIFTVTRAMETDNTYGWGTSGNGIDTHMMKNVEWGVVVYLSKSTYGKNTEIWINNSSTYTTGCAGSAVATSSFAGCQNAYNTANGMQASTTGNIYGIYDMNGSAYEYVAAYVNNNNYNLNTYGGDILNENSKYKDVYTVGITDSKADNYAVAINKKGDAIYEISGTGSAMLSGGWYSDVAQMPATDYPWFLRGAPQSYSDQDAGAFGFNLALGGTNVRYGFRPALLVAEGL